jgi:serine-type D-Ala-D-Ala carboxypeptidase/endopeptidase (penicillin-binding protein 4)
MQMKSVNKLYSRNSKIKKLRRIGLSTLAAVLYFILAPSLCPAASPDDCLACLGPEDSAALADPSGRILYAVNEDKPRVPASTLKILTALAAFQSFDVSYRFPTKFFVDAGKNLYVKGFGDPLLTSEALAELAQAVSEKIHAITDIVVDRSYFSDVAIPGTNRSPKPYNAPVGALSCNFNTVAIGTGPGGGLVSGEGQTPLVPYAAARLERLGVNRKGRYTFIHNTRDAALYTGELLSHFLKGNGVLISGKVKAGTVPPEAVELMTWFSPWTITEAVERMLEFSNNFVANQLFLAVGAMEMGPPGNLEKSLHVVENLVRDSLGLGSLKIVEGSGISRENRISAENMLVLLRRFAPYRQMLKGNYGIAYKTGTLKGVRTRAGYIEPIPGKLYPFAVFVDEKIQDIDNIVRCLDRAAKALIGESKRP